MYLVVRALAALTGIERMLIQGCRRKDTNGEY